MNGEKPNTLNGEKLNTENGVNANVVTDPDAGDGDPDPLAFLA